MKTFIVAVIVSILALTASVTAHANPVAKLCRGSTVLEKAYEEYKAVANAKKKQVCFHLGRITGQILENMTFKENARKNLTPALLAMADEMVDRASTLKSFCGGAVVNGKLERGVRENDTAELTRQLGVMFGTDQGREGLNSRLLSATCPNGVPESAL